MRVGFSNFYRGLDPIIFQTPNAPIGDDLLLPFNRLSVAGARRGIFFVPLDEHSDATTFDAFLFADMPERRIPYIEAVFRTGLPRYLITFECEGVKPDNWTQQNHLLFKKIFTWADWLIGERFAHLHVAQDLGATIFKGTTFTQRRLATLIASNKSIEHPRELYSERRRTIEWFEAHHPSDLDLFGPGWPALGWEWPSLAAYHGLIPPGLKRKVMSHYRFSFVYENVEGLPGYITEKLFDAFLAGCVPIYWGAPNIDRHVDPNAYIDRRSFTTHEQMYSHLASMTETRWEEYRQAARAWMRSPAAHPFTIDAFVETILTEITR